MHAERGAERRIGREMSRRQQSAVTHCLLLLLLWFVLRSLVVLTLTLTARITGGIPRRVISVVLWDTQHVQDRLVLIFHRHRSQTNIRHKVTKCGEFGNGIVQLLEVFFVLHVFNMSSRFHMFC